MNKILNLKSKFLLFLACILTSFVFFTSCSSPSSPSRLKNWMSGNNKIKILATTRMIADLVEQIGGDRVDVLTLIDGSLDPHSYELVKGDNEKILRADIIFYNGLGLEHSPSIHHHLTTSDKAYAFGDYIRQIDPEKILWIDGKEDPHIWMDVSLWITCSDLVETVLIQNDPNFLDYYKQNKERLVEAMYELHQNIYDLMQSIEEEKRFLVTSHDAFNYFARSYLCTTEEVSSKQWKNRFRAPEGLAPDSLLSTTDIQNIINHMADHQIEVLFLESNVSPDSIKKIVSAGNQLGLKLKIADVNLYADAMGEPGSPGDTYMKMLKHNAQIIAENLKRNRGSL